jgi:predicted ATPase
VFFVSLAPLQSVEAIVPTIAQAIGFTFYSREEPREQLLSYLRHKNVLLVLDNYEHLLQGAGLVPEILQVAPEVVALVTSRSGLHVQGEYRFPVSGMSYPAFIPPTVFGRRGGGALQYSAIRLFAAGALRAQPNLDLTGQALADVVRICQLVDGIPLAIVLAAAWVEMLTPAEIAAEIEGQMSGLGLDILETELSGVPERQRSMRAVFDHSWRLLPPRGQEILAGLSVFRGGFTREAAQCVTGASLRELMVLVNRSLLHRAPTGRYDVHELLRQYAAEKLAQSPDAGEAAHDRHCAHYAQFLAQRRDTFRKRGLGDAVEEIANIRAAWEWALQHARLPEIRRSLEGIWWLGAYRDESSMLAQAVDLLRRAEPTRENQLALGLALGYLAVSLNWAGLPQAASPLAQEGLSLVRRLGTGRVLALGHALAFYGGVAKDATQARQLLDQGLAIAQEADRPLEVCWILNALGWTALNRGRYNEAEQHWLTFLRIASEIDHRRGQPISLGGLGHAARFRGQYARARAYYAQSLALFRKLGDRGWIARRLNDLGAVTLASGDLEQARARYREALSSSEELTDLMQVARALCGLGEVALAAEDIPAARRRCQRVLQVAMADQRANVGREALIPAARLVAHRGEREQAVELVALALCERSSFPGEALHGAEEFLGELQSALSPDVYAAAQERGRQRDLWATVEELLAGLEEQQVL